MRLARKLSALVLSIFFVSSLVAQTVSAPAEIASQKTTAARPKVAVVLSGGGAKGFAHIALLEALEEEGIPIDLLTGTSMGSMIGALYASGYSAKEIRQIISTTDMMNLILEEVAASSPLPPEAFNLSKGNLISYPVSLRGVGAAPGLLGDEKILTFMGRLLAKNYDIESFDQLPIPYRAIGTDVLTYTPYVFENGSLLKAVRGSMSLPMLFTPAPTGTGRYVMDGGLVNNLPVHLARELGADIIIACDVASNLPEDTTKLSTASDMGIHLFNFFISPNATKQHPEADLLITPDLAPYNTLSFMFPNEIMELGEKAVAPNKDAIHAIALYLQDCGVELTPADPDRISVYAAKPAPVVESVQIEDVSSSGPSPIPATESYSWIVGRELTDAAMNRLTAQLIKDRTKYNLSSLSFETRPGTEPQSCTLVLVANHYPQNPGILAVGGVPTLSATFGNGKVSGIIFPELNFLLHLDQPFSQDYFFGFGSTITGGVTLSPQIARLDDFTLHLDTGVAVMNGGISPDTGFSWLNKPLIEDVALTTHLGLETRFLRYSTTRSGFQYTLSNTSSSLLQSAAGYGKLVMNSFRNPVSGWNGLRIDAEVLYGLTFGDLPQPVPQWAAEYKMLQMISLTPDETAVGYELSAGTKRGTAVLAENYYEYGGLQGMCGYPGGTRVRDYAMAGVRYQMHLFTILGMPALAQFQVKAGVQNPTNTAYCLESFSPVDAGYGAYILLNSPVGNITLGFSQSITTGRFCFSAGLQ